MNQTLGIRLGKSLYKSSLEVGNSHRLKGGLNLEMSKFRGAQSPSVVSRLYFGILILGDPRSGSGFFCLRGSPVV